MPRDLQFPTLSGNVLPSNQFNQQPAVVNSYYSQEYDQECCCSDEMAPVYQSQSPTLLPFQNQHTINTQSTMNYPNHLSPQPSSAYLSPQPLSAPKSKKSTKMNNQIPPNFNKTYISMISAQLDSSLEFKNKNAKKFTNEEDQIILQLVGDQRYPNWNEIAKHIKGKTGRQCRERYQHYLCPSVSHEPWTPEEDMLILKLYNQHGPNWALMSQHFNGRRTNNNIKNRFNNHICCKYQTALNTLNQFPPQNAPTQTQYDDIATSNFNNQQFTAPQPVTDEANTEMDYNDGNDYFLNDGVLGFDDQCFDFLAEDQFNNPFSFTPFEI